jgi:PST family polysaccharide transporter
LVAQQDDIQGEPPLNLREATLAGVRWITMARIVGQVLALVSAVLVARLVPPAEFGRAAVALIVVPVSLAVASQGFGSRLVQRKELVKAHAEAAAVLSLVSGLLLTAALIGLSPILAAPLFDERTVDLLQLAAPIFLLVAIGTVPQAMLQRRLSFRQLAIIETSALTAGTAVTIGLALAGANAPALVGGALVNASLTAILSWAAAPKIAPRWKRSEAADVLRFGLPASLSSLTHAVFRNVDYAIISARLGAAPLGYYSRAFRLGAESYSRISTIMLRIAFPVYSRTKDLHEMRRVRARIVRAHAAVIWPILAVLIATAPLLIPLVFGPAWEPAVELTQILAVGGMIAAVITGVGPLMLAIGRPRQLFAYNVGTALSYGVLVYLVTPFGLTTVCWAFVGFQLVNFFTSHALLLRRFVGIPLRGILADVGPAGVGSAAVLAVALPCVSAGSGEVPDPLLLVLTAGVALSTYAVVLRLLFPAMFKDLVLLASRVLPTTRLANPRSLWLRRALLTRAG